MARIFVSYNHEGKAVAKVLADDIEALGHIVSFDQDLSGGQTWWNQILAMIRDCDVFVFILNPEALESTACTREYGYAADLGKAILPVLVAEGVPTNLLPPALSQIQYVDYRKQDHDAALHLARAFNSLSPPRPLPDPLPVPPEVPMSYLGRLAAQIETPSTLTYEQQSALVLDLEKGLHDPEASHDASTLLHKLRKRHDLFARVAEAIDELFPGTNKVVSGEPKISGDAVEASIRIPSETGRESRGVQMDKPSTHERLVCSLAGGIFGTVVGVAAMTTFRGPPEFELALFTGAGGAISGAITGKNRRLIVAVLYGAALGWFIVALLWGIREARIAAGAIYGAPLGAILAAISGAIVRRVKKRSTSGVALRCSGSK